MSAAPKTSPLIVAAESLLAMGFRIVPIMPGQKAPGEYIAGRWQAMANWTRYKTVAPTKFELSLWAKWPDANIGIILGSPSGDGLVTIALDLDLSDPDELDSVVRQLPYTPMSKKGAKGLTLFYRASPDVKSRAFNRTLPEINPKTGRPKQDRIADMLTGNATKQTVVPPSIHPDGFAYAWIAGPVPARDLPVLDAAAIERFEEAARALGWDASPQANAPPGITRHTQVTPRAPTPAGDSESVWKALNAAALADLNAWVPELQLYNVRPARSGFEAVAIWRPSSTGRPDEMRKRNLSIQATGIKDFGTEATYSPLDLVAVALGLTFSQAFDWLTARVVVPDTSGVVLKFDPKKSDEAPNESDFGSGEEDDTSNIRSSPAFFIDDGQLEEWPEELCYPNGLVGQIARWITDTASEPAPLLAYGAALAIVGTVAGRQFRGPTKTGTHLYIIGAAPTGAGKDWPLQAIATALNDAGMPLLIGPSDFTSDGAVTRHIKDFPQSVCLMDEFGSFWKRINHWKAGNWETAITRALREPWGRSFGVMRTKQYAGIGPTSEDIWHPAMSIFGVTTPAEFFGALSGADIENGMANRLLVLSTRRRADDRRTPAEAQAAYFGSRGTSVTTPKHVIEGLQSIRDFQGALLGSQFAWPASKRPTAPLVDVLADTDAKNLLFSYKQWIDDRTAEDEAFGKFYSRGAEMAQRVAMIHAIGQSVCTRTPPTISLADARMAVRLIDWALRVFWARLTDHQTPQTFGALADKIVDCLGRKAGVGTTVNRSKLRRWVGTVPTRMFDEAVETLREMKRIGVGGGRDGALGRKPQVFWLL